MKVFQSSLCILLVAMLTPGLSLGGESCNVCGINNTNAKDRITDPKCKNDPNCLNCVVSALTQSQSGMQCMANEKMDKTRNGEAVNAAINVGATITCGVACAMTMLPVTATASTAWNKACGYAGLAVTGVEIAYTIKNLVQGNKPDAISLAMTGYAALNTAKGLKTASAAHAAAVAAKKALAKGAEEATSKASKLTLKKLSSPACANAILFGISAATKLKSGKEAKKGAGEACTNAQALATSGANSAVQSCLTDKSSGVSSSQLDGFFTATPETFTPAKLTDVDTFAASANKDLLKDLKNDMAMAEKEGKMDLGDISKRLDNGESVASIVGSAGIPAPILDQIKNGEAQVNSGDTSKLLAAISGGYAPGAGLSPAESDSDSELSFGSASAPGEGAESLEIDRKPSSNGMMVVEDGDVFHSAFPGSIFDVVSFRIKHQKSSYAELDPAGRVNRLFNGYSDPLSSGQRLPANSATKLKK